LLLHSENKRDSVITGIYSIALDLVPHICSAIARRAESKGKKVLLTGSLNGHSPLFGLDGQVAVVTGGATGIGEAIARRLASAGARVVIIDLNLDGAALVTGSLGNESFGIDADVSDGARVNAVIKTIFERTGRIDILVNNAGIAGPPAPVWQQTDENWQRNIAVNLTGVFNSCRAVVPHMRDRQYGRIVNVASIAGKEGNPNMAPYSATKGAVIAFTKSLGKELATDGICVNAVAPAVIQTQILDQLTTAQVSYMTERIPMKRTGRPEEIAAVVHFLSSPDCSFLTAQCYDASGGRATY
jgi:NAD(P)-dependent dehydrogenase (short-subunit alcohol dehydrogenase family)